MCGIVGLIAQKPVVGSIINGLKALEYRGYDSAGISVLHDNQIKAIKFPGRVAQLEELIQQENFPAAHIGIGHTRWATHGKPNLINAHPHQAGSVSLVHNGIIENYADLKKELIALGAEFKSETDTEVIAHYINYQLKNSKNSIEQILAKMLTELHGEYAVAILIEQEPGKMFCVRKGAPLILGVLADNFICASDRQAILPLTDTIINLPQECIIKGSAEHFEILDPQLQKMNVKSEKIDWTPDMLSKGGFAHFMLKEIYEQPVAARRLLQKMLSADTMQVNLPFIEADKEYWKNIRTLNIVACGTAMHAGFIAKYYLEQFNSMTVQIDIASEFRYKKCTLTPDQALLVITQSGETADTLAVVRLAKAKGLKTIGLVNVRGSTIDREVDQAFYTEAGPEIGVASTKAFTSQVLALYLFTLELARVRGEMDVAQYKERLEQVQTLPHHLETVTSLEPMVKNLAKKYMTKHTFLFIGRDFFYPLSLEGALKLKEICYDHAEGYAAGELKHGPIAMIDENVLIFALAAKNMDIYSKTINSVEEVRSRSGFITGVGIKSDQSLINHCDDVILVDDLAPELLPITMAIPLQLFSYHLALLRGTDIDKPRNLAKSVTVE